MRRFFTAGILSMAVVLTAFPAAADDGEIARSIAGMLRDSGALRDYSVGVKYKNGTAWLSGQVTSTAQLAAAAHIAQQAPGVKKVINKIAVMPPNESSIGQPAVQAASFNGAARKGSSANIRKRRNARSMPPRPIQVNYPPAQGNMMPAMGGNMMQGAPGGNMMQGMPGGGPMPAHVPGTGGGIHPAVYDQPHLPNYAWPSYAAHPNYAALTYPKQYSPTAWPYIGPFYPYPQVPLGWRKITLQWDDGWWFLDFYDR